jgi:hypothetical protein
MGSSSEELEALRKFTLICLEGYAKAAVCRVKEANILREQAEAMVIRSMTMTDEAREMFARCNELALQYAKAKAAHVEEPEVAEAEDMSYW